MKIIDKARELVRTDDAKGLARFCKNMFKQGHTDQDVVELMRAAGYKKDGIIYHLYDEWQNAGSEEYL